MNQKSSTIDINCDMGEGYPHDFEMIQYISSVNISCGAHAGSVEIMKKTISAAIKAGVAIGAHPGYPDRKNFGRVEIGLSKKEIVMLVLEQMEVFSKGAAKAGGKMNHLKLHGALYNRAAADSDLMFQIASAVVSVYGSIHIYSLAGSTSIKSIKEAGAIPVNEAFADRAYNNDGTLVSRKLAGAVIKDVDKISSRVAAVALNKSIDNIPTETQSICIHGDTPGALNIAAKIKEVLTKEGITIARVL